MRRLHMRRTSTETQQRLQRRRADHDTADRSDVGVVATPSDGDVAAGRDDAVRRIEVEPTVVGDPHRAPRVRRVGTDRARPRRAAVRSRCSRSRTGPPGRASAGSRRRDGRSPDRRRAARARMSPSGVLTSVNVGSNANVSKISVHRASTPSRIGRPGRERRGRQAQQCRTMLGHGHVPRRRGERRRLEHQRAAHGGDLCRDALPRLVRPRPLLRIHHHFGHRLDGELVVRPVDAELHHPVAEHVGPLVVLVRRRRRGQHRRQHALRRCRPDEQVGDAVAVGHRRAVRVVGAVGHPVAGFPTVCSAAIGSVTTVVPSPVGRAATRGRR